MLDQAIRSGKSTKDTTNVVLNEFKDPQGNTVYPNITGVLANQAEVYCRCSGSCACVPGELLVTDPGPCSNVREAHLVPTCLPL